MRIFVEDVINFPQQAVYDTQRNEMAKLVAYLPNINKIEVLEREERDGGVRIVNLWRAAATDVPRIIRPFVKPEMLQWHDYAEWFDDDHYCTWRLKTGFFTEQVSVRGKTSFLRLGENKSKCVIDGDLSVDHTRLPGVPRLVAKKVVKEVEKLVIRLMTPNMTSVNRGIERYLAQK
jgi:hypothetical protein